MSLYGGVTLPGKPDLANIQRLDLLPVPMIRTMSRFGIAIDVPYLQEFSSQLAREMKSLERDISSYMPPADLADFSRNADQIEVLEGDPLLNANSADQIRSLLFAHLRVGSKRELKLTKSGKISTGKKTLELCTDDHPVVRKVLEYRERSKLKSAFADALPRFAKYHPHGSDCPICGLFHRVGTTRVHTEFLTTRAETGRFSSRRPNLQQIPVRSELGGRIRRAFVASPGTRLVSVDFSQIELRDTAHCSKAQSMIDIYKADKDIHLYTACTLFNKNYDHYAALAKKRDKWPEEKADWNDFSLNCRLPSKNVNFMILYGASARGLQAQLALSGLFWTVEDCEGFISKWFNLYPEVQEYINQQYYRARRYQYVWDVFGRIRRVPEVNSYHQYIRAQGLRQAVNMPIQSCSAGQIKLVMGELNVLFEDMRRMEDWVWPLLTIHDQLIVEAEAKIADTVCELMQISFSRVMHDRTTYESLWRVPISSDGEILTRWSKGE